MDDSKFDEELFAIAGSQEEGGMAVVVAADVHIDAHVVPVDNSQDEDDIRPPPAVVTDAHDASVAVNQDRWRQPRARHDVGPTQRR